jgi:chromosome segregation ATPase
MHRLLPAVIVSFLFLSNSAFAAPAKSVADLQAQTAATETKISDARRSLTQLEASVAAAEKAEQELQIDFDKKKKAWEGSSTICKSAICSYLPKAEGDPALKAEMDKARAALVAAQAQRKQAQKDRDDVQEAVEDLTDAASKETRDLASANRALATAIKGANLMADFNSVVDRAGSVDDALDYMESQYDKALLGAYLQDKMSMLLNSNAFCKAQLSCEGGKNKGMLPHAAVQQELFPSAKDVTRSGEYREKLKSIREAGSAPAAPAKGSTGGSTN